MKRKRKPSDRPWYFGYLISALRRVWSWSPEKRAVLTRTNQGGGYFRCEGECGKIHPKKSVHVDHQNPVIPVSGFDSWSGVVERIFCPASELKLLCKPEHALKTKAENAQRRKFKKELENK